MRCPCGAQSANILLDRGLLGRIGDFGIARSVTEDGATATHVQTLNAAGSSVYMAPECASSSIVGA